MSKLFEILIPCQTNDNQPIDDFTHKVWDAMVREITGGLTIMPTVKGQWVSPSDKLLAEKMIPVRIATTYLQMEKIADITAKFYEQRAVMFYLVGECVTIKEYPEHEG